MRNHTEIQTGVQHDDYTNDITTSVESMDEQLKIQ